MTTPAADDLLDDPLYGRLAAAERRDPDLREVLELLAGGAAPVTDTTRRVAHDLNVDRGARLRAAFIRGALTSREVVGLLGVNDHRAVAARRARGTLLGWTVGNETYHPDWQFTDSGPVDALPRVVHALQAITSSPLAADQLMRRPREELGGASLAELLADGRSDLVERSILATAA